MNAVSEPVTTAARRLGVLQVLPAISRAEAGVWFAAQGLAQALALRGRARVRVAGPVRADSSELAGELRQDGIDVVPLATAGPSFAEWPRDAARALGDARPDIIHLHGLWRPVGAGLLRLRAHAGVPYVLSPHGMLEPWALRRSAWKKRLAALVYEGRTVHRAGAIHALCEDEVRSVRDFGYRGPVCIVPNGVALPPRPVEPARVRGEGEPQRLLFLGRIDAKKGLHLLLPAFARALRDTPAAAAWQLVIAGFGDEAYATSLREIVAASGLESHVRLAGPVFGAAKDELLRSADAFVLPSFSEGLPMSILEAAAHGLPVLCSRECNMPDVFECGAGARLSLDVERMGVELGAFFATDAPARARMARAARALVEDKYQWDRVSASFESVYAWLACGGPRPDCVILD
jgi:poly(glycerol-phosphate) alpha-glucosyltransferase